MTTDFDESGTESEAQAVNGDSGGGVFHKNGDQWELIGIMHAVSPDLSGQNVADDPETPEDETIRRVVFDTAADDVLTYSSDLTEYRELIMDIIAPLPGDANLDGSVDATDASILAAHWGLGEGVLWGHGDFNEDGVIDELDATILAANWGTSSTEGQTEQQRQATIPEPSMTGLILAGLVGLLVSLPYGRGSAEA